ncbi:MAG: M50 family metallopeptidase [Bacteroidota bacterium]
MNEDYKIYILYSLPVVVFILNRIPYVGKYLRVVNTLIHESGHAVAALIASGEVYNVELFSDRSGTTVTKRANSKGGRFLVAFSGYPFGSAVAYGLFFLISIDKCNMVLYALACIAVLNLMFYVRNNYGIFWLITFTALIFIVNIYGNEMVQYAFSAWLCGIMLFEALYSSIELISICRKKPKNAGDASDLASITKIPSMFWAFVFFAQACMFIYLSAKLFIKL